MDHRQPVRLLLRHKEARVLHAERLKELAAQIIAEAHAGRDLHHRAEHVGGSAVHPPLPGLEGERLAPDAIGELHRAQGAGTVRGGLRLLEQPVERGGRLIPGIGNPRGHVEQVVQLNLAHALFERPVSPHLLLREGGQIARNGIHQIDEAVLPQLHHRHGSDRLCH